MSTPSTALARLPEDAARRGITEAHWNVLTNSLFPGARPESVLLAWDYCVARHLDPLKKSVHIVPLEVKNAKTNQYEWRDVILPGIAEQRTTAFRTGLYQGMTDWEYGPEVDFRGCKTFEWCATKIKRLFPPTGETLLFPVRVLFREVVATKADGKPNARWARAPVQMLEKCTEGQGLRRAFPEELGGELTEEEMAGQRAIDVAPVSLDDVIEATVPKPEGYDAWFEELTKATDEGGTDLFREGWRNSPVECREYLRQCEPTGIDALKKRALAADAKKHAARAATPATPGNDDVLNSGS